MPLFGATIFSPHCHIVSLQVNTPFFILQHVIINQILYYANYKSCTTQAGHELSGPLSKKTKTKTKCLPLLDTFYPL